MAGVKPYPLSEPAPNAALVVPDDNNDLVVTIADIDARGAKLHNYGSAGLVYVDCAVSGTTIPLYMRQGDYSPVAVKRVRSTNLGSGVLLVALW